MTYEQTKNKMPPRSIEKLTLLVSSPVSIIQVGNRGAENIPPL